MATPMQRNITEGAGNPAPPPPPPDSRARMLVATERAARQATRVYRALEDDPATDLHTVYRAWDVAVTAQMRHDRLARRLRTRQTWQGVREMLWQR